MRRLRARIRLLGRRRRRLARELRAAFARLAALSRRAIRAGIILGVIAGLSLTAGALAATLYGQFGFYPGRNADAWASRQPAFTGATSCAACHAAEASRWAAAPHAGVTCESCHGPLAGHPLATQPPVASAAPGSSGPPVPLLDLDEASTIGLPDAGPTALCLTCHRAVVGRPTGFPAIDPAKHFAGPDCIVCHDPHAAAATAPPLILHPIIGMPECTVCHSVAGMRPLPSGHPAWSGDCLTCHRRLEP